MADDPKPALVALRDRRDAVIQLLENGYASDLLPDAAFEERIARAHAALDVASLDALVADLEVTTALVPQRAVGPQLVPVRPKILALFSSVERSGTYALPASLSVRAVFGSTVLDLREAQLAAGETVLSLRVVFGSIEIIVPPELAVVCDGGAILGSFEHAGHSPVLDPERPLLRIVGTAIFGSIEVKVRPRGTWKKLLADVAQKLLR